MVGLSRRNFLFTSISAMVAATIAPEMAIASDYVNKINSLEKLFDNIVYYGSLKTNKEQYKSLNQAWIDLLKFINENFSLPNSENYETTMQSMTKLFSRETNVDWRDIPPVIVEEAIPVAVVRELMSNKKIKMVAFESEYWLSFINRYQYLILNA